MLVSFIPTQCVSQCRLVYILDGSMIGRPNASHHAKTNPSPEKMVLSYFQTTQPDCRIDSNVTTGRQKKLHCFIVDGVCNIVFEAIGCYYHYCPCQEARLSSTDVEIERGVRKRQQHEMLIDYIRKPNR